MGNTQSRIAQVAVAEAQHNDSRKWKEVEHSVHDLPLEHLTLGELRAIENVVRQQMALERKEEERRRQSNVSSRRMLSSSSYPSVDSSQKAPDRRRAGTGRNIEFANCPRCGQKRDCLKVNLHFPEASKLMDWQACENCVKEIGSQISSGDWYHGSNTDQTMSMCHALLQRIVECKSQAKAEDPKQIVVTEVADEVDNKPPAASRQVSNTSVASKGTLQRLAKGNNWIGRIQLYITYSKSSRSLKVAIMKVLDLVNCEPATNIGVQVSLMPQRSSADCQLSQVSPFRKNGVAEYDKLLTWSQLRRRELPDCTLEASVWQFSPVHFLGKADISLGFLLKSKGEETPQFYSLFCNSSTDIRDQVVGIPSFSGSFDAGDGDDMDRLGVEPTGRMSRRSTEFLAAIAEENQLARISSSAVGDLQDDDNDITFSSQKSQTALQSEEYFTSPGDDTGFFLTGKSFQHGSQEGLLLQSSASVFSGDTRRSVTRESSMRELEDDIEAVSLRLDQLDEQEKKSQSSIKTQDTPAMERKASRLSIDNGASPSPVKAHTIPKQKTRMTSDGDDKKSIHSKISIATSESSNNSLTEADRVIPQTLWSERVPGDTDIPDNASSKQDSGDEKVKTDVGKTDSMRGPVQEYSPKIGSIGRQRPGESPSAYDTGKESPVPTADEKTAYSGSVRLSIVEVNTYTLEITVHQVKNADKFIMEGKPAPQGLYCKVYMNTDNKKIKAKTRVEPYSSSVTFDEKLVLEGRLQNADLEVMLWETHGRVGRHTMSSTCTISLDHLHLQKQLPATHWYKLMQPDRQRTNTGTLSLKRPTSRASMSSWVFQRH